MMKSLLILVAPIASGQMLNSAHYLKLFLAMAGFTLIASSVYVLNDIMDAELDRNHPKKMFRPIASGAVSIIVARFIFAGTFLLGFTLLLNVNTNVVLLGLAYTLIQISYIFMLKHVSIFEIFCVASGFLIRALVGSATISVDPSPWLLAIVSSGALTIVTGKRLSEKSRQSLLPNLSLTRPVLNSYSEQGLTSILTISAGCTIVSYISWALQPRFESNIPITISCIPFMISILAYINLIFNVGVEEPENDLTRMQILIPGALTLFLVFIGATV